jgi:tellurite resistance protein TerC
VFTAFVRVASESRGDEHFAQLDVPAWQWMVFFGLVFTLLLADLLILHREPKAMPFKEAAVESGVWIAIGLSFSFVILWWHGGQATGEYLSGYLIELSLSVDNVFVWAVILTFFAVPRQFQFRVLFWGIFGALVLRAIFIFAGVALIETFDWILYVFGGFLLYTAWRIARHDESEAVDYEANIALRAVRRLLPSTTEYDGQKLFTRQNGRRLATPLFAVLVLVEFTDVVFAVDSVPAILAVAREQFIVYSSNAFAILGLRSMYFLLAGMAGRFRYLNIGLGVILAFVGMKMLLSEVWHAPTWLSLTVIIVVLTVTIVASLIAERGDEAAEAVAVTDEE